MTLKKDIIETEFRTSGSAQLQNQIGVVEGNISKLNRETERLKINKKKLEAQNKKNTKEWKNLDQEIKKNEKSLQEYNTTLGKLNKQLKVTDMTARQLTKRKRELAREMNNTSKAADPKRWKELNTQYDQASKQLTKVRAGARKTNKVMSSMKAALPIVGVAALIGMVKRLGGELFGLTKTIQGEAVRSQTVFGNQLKFVQEEAKGLAEQMGLTNREFVSAAAGTADLLIPLDFTRKKAAEMSVELQSLAGALDEWTGGQIGATGVSEILTKAMLGENEQLKRLGIAIRKDSEEFRFLVKQKLADTGATKAQAEALATLELIQKKSADAQTAYTQEGNKLLRMQKSLRVATMDLKEGFVGLFEQSIAEKLAEERKEVILLTGKLLDSNTSYEDRVKLLERLEDISPDIVKGINAEKIEYDKLNKNLQLYNDTLTKRIVLANLQEDEEKSLTKLARRSEELGKAQLMISDLIINNELGTILQDYDDWADRLTAVTEHLNNVVQTEEDITGFTDKVQNGWIQFGQMDPVSEIWDDAKKDLRFIAEVLLPNLEESQEGFNEQQGKTIDFSARIAALKEILGITEEIEEVEKEIIISDEEREKRRKAGLKKATDELKIAAQEQENMLLKLRTDGAMDQQQLDDALIVEKIANLNMEIEVRKQFNEDYSDLEGEILEIQVANLNKIQKEKDDASAADLVRMTKDAADKKRIAEQEFREAQRELDRKYDSVLSFTENSVDAFLNAAIEKQNIEKNFNADALSLQEEFDKESIALEEQFTKDSISLKEQIEIQDRRQQEFKDAMFALEQQRNKDEIDARKQILKDVLLEGVKFLRRYAQLKIAEITIGSLASVESIATFGIAGIAKAAGLTLLVESALALATAGINKLDVGGHTGPGTKHQPAGIVHANEYVIPQEGYFNPNLRPFIDMIENARQAGSLRSLNPQTITSGFADGGPTDSIQQAVPGTLDPAVVELLRATYQLLNKLDREGVFSIIGDRQIRDIRDRTNIIEGIEQSVSG